MKIQKWPRIGSVSSSFWMPYVPATSNRNTDGPSKYVTVSEAGS